MEDKNITFIARHYRTGRFNTREGWRRLGIFTGSRLRAWRIAAAATAVVAISATATFIYNTYSYNAGPSPDTQEETISTEQPLLVVRAIDFDDTPLPIVVARIREVYGVEVDSVPADAAKHHLTLHYEGNVADLVENINEILGTQMSIEE